MATNDSKSNGIPFEFTGTGRVATRLYRGKASIENKLGKYYVSGWTLKGNSMMFVSLYWICAVVTALGVGVLLLSIALKLGYYQKVPEFTMENFFKAPGPNLINIMIDILCIAGGYYASIYFCKFVLRKRTVAEIPSDSVAAIVKGAEFMRKMDNNQSVPMCHGIIRMKNPIPSIKIICRLEDCSRLSSLLDVPLINENK